MFLPLSCFSDNVAAAAEEEEEDYAFERALFLHAPCLRLSFFNG